ARSREVCQPTLSNTTAASDANDGDDAGNARGVEMRHLEGDDDQSAMDGTVSCGDFLNILLASQK
ncbi:hypothetical protein BOX15_Mlig011869g1, partial [Macrostomum lignano]